jgi:hypothetical protein
MTIAFTYDRWPLLLLTQQGKTCDRSMESYLLELDSLRLRGRMFAIVLDLRSGEPFSFAQRARQNRWLDEHPEHLNRLLGIAFVESSWMMRGAMRAAFLARPPTFPFLVTSDIEEGSEWAEARLAAHDQHRYFEGFTSRHP